MACHSIFTTYETPELSKSIVVQYSQTDLRPFSRDTLFISVYESCRHQEKSSEHASALTETIIKQLLSENGGSVDRQAIIEKCVEVLKRFDGAAATIYSAYHR